MTPLLLLTLLAPLQESREVRKARSYLNEVKRHLLESYIDRDKLDDARLVSAALRGLDKGLEHKDLGASPDVQDAARRALRAEETLGGALEAVAHAAPGLDLLRWADHGAHAMIRETGDPFSRVLTAEDMKDLLKMMGGGGKEEQTAGCALHPDGKAWKVVYVQYGTPAYEAGLEIGDEVTAVRGRTPSDVPPDELSKLLVLRGGETLELSVRRNGRTYAFRLRPSSDPRTVHVEHLG
ncbi:MAG TPA: PDZ domain-containing protein, partial [Planctomycetota bacterium]|nr:PDZ domain-containing protein [Planctomycetota bacterium]